jgi:small subunit ribosomal protein S1
MTDPKDDSSFASLFEASVRGEKRAAPLRPGEMAEGMVVSLGKGVVFVELDGKRQGILELGPDDAADAYNVGATVKAKVLSVDGKTQSVRLGAAPPTATEGTVVGATVEKVEPFGVFVQVDGIPGRGGRGLIPNAELGTPRGADIRKLFPEGTKVSAKVIGTEPGRLRLSIRGAKGEAEAAEFEGFKKTREKEKQKPAEPRSLGTFGDLLKGRALVASPPAAAKADPKPKKR